MHGLFARVALIIVVGLAAAQALTFALIRYERGEALHALMINNVELDIATSVALRPCTPKTVLPTVPSLVHAPSRQRMTSPSALPANTSSPWPHIA